MKELTFKEVIDNIKEGEIYRNTDKGASLQAIEYNVNIIFHHISIDCNELHINKNYKFIKEQKPVDFMTAITAYYEERKTIKSVVEDCERIYKFEGIGLVNIRKIAISATEILQGKWYIEEEN